MEVKVKNWRNDSKGRQKHKTKYIRQQKALSRTFQLVSFKIWANGPSGSMTKILKNQISKKNGVMTKVRK